jgi:hypothetical protein
MLVYYDKLGLLFISLAFNIWWFGKLKSFMMFPCTWVSFVPYLFHSFFKPLCYKYSTCSFLFHIFLLFQFFMLYLIMVGMWASVCCLVEKTEKKDVMYILPIVYVSMTPWLKALTQQIGHKMAYRPHIQMVANLHKCFHAPLKFCVFLMVSLYF